MLKKNVFRSCILLLCLSLELGAVTIDDVQSKKDRLAAVIKKYKYQPHPAVNNAYLSYKRMEAMYDLQERKVKIPANFIKWIDKTPEVSSAIYGTRENVADVIETLWALRLGLGGKRFQKYTQLMLAGALFNSKLKDKANNLRAMVRLKPSAELLKDPRKLVNTRSRKRKLDMNDHIINFLNSIQIKSENNANDLHLFTELKYDSRGIAKSNKSVSTKKGPKIRTLYASDVMADPVLQQKFNAYMKQKGFPNVRINCGDHLIYWKSSNMVDKQKRGEINKAYQLFKTAYEEKGLLPKTRNLPTLSEWLSFLIRNDQVKNVSKGSWPLFPLDSPWPVLRLLTYNYKMQTLRECEERWVAYRDKGEKRCYGEYIGSVAQQYDMQSARRLAPYPFTYGSFQMIMKDGGVCGLMARMGTLTQLTLGIPAVQAGQPGHCALIVYGYDKKESTYYSTIQQSVTAGPEGTWPHANYNFADTDKRLSMIYDQATAYAVNYSQLEFTKSLIAYNAFNTLPEAEQKKYIFPFFRSAIKINPYNLLLVDKAVALADQPQLLVRIGQEFSGFLATIEKKGCPTDGLYPKTVRDEIIAKIGKLDIPKNKKIIRYVYNFLMSAPCEDKVLMNYRLKIENPQAVFKQLELDFKAYLKGVWTLPLKVVDVKTSSLNASLKAFGDTLKSNKMRKDWALRMLKLMQKKEMYFNAKNDLVVNPIYTFFVEASGVTSPPAYQLLHNAQAQLFSEIKQACVKSRKFSAADFKTFAQNISGVVQTHGKASQTTKWLANLRSLLKSHKKITVSSGDEIDNPCYLILNELKKKK